ncbi:MAG: hypothetical protein ACLFQQ_03615 [Desulfococcaceae bacterium]
MLFIVGDVPPTQKIAVSIHGIFVSHPAEIRPVTGTLPDKIREEFLLKRHDNFIGIDPLLPRQQLQVSVVGEADIGELEIVFQESVAVVGLGAGGAAGDFAVVLGQGETGRTSDRQPQQAAEDSGKNRLLSENFHFKTSSAP